MRTLAAVLLPAILALPALADSPVVLKFQQSGTNLIITAGKADDSELYWRLKLDETRGTIREFYDLTSVAGTGWNYVSSYGFAPGLFAPFDPEIRNGTSWTYAAGPKVNGQTSYTYTLTNTVSYASRTTTVTINVPTATGTTLSGVTVSVYSARPSTAQSATAEMTLHAVDATQMDAIYAGAMQNDVSIDGTLWSQVQVKDSSVSTALGLTPGRNFRLTSLNLHDGGYLQLDGATVLGWQSPYEVRNTVYGAISTASQSKPNPGDIITTNVRLDINIAAGGMAGNQPPVAIAGPDQNVLDANNDGTQPVTLNGQASYDADGSIAAYVWKEGASTLASGATATVGLSVGVHPIVLTVTDNEGATGEDTVLVTVEANVPQTYYVDRSHASASDTNPGTEAYPFKTIAKGLNVAEAGDTVLVKEGIYREQVAFPRSGVTDAPITLKGAPGQRVVVAGSRELTGWAVLPEGQARGNPNFGRIYYVDLNWQPPRLDENGVRLEQAKSPNTGWFLVGDGSDGTHIVDAVNLTQSDPGYWVDARLYYVDMQPSIEHERTVTGYDPATHSVTFSGGTLSWFDANNVEYPPVPGIDRYQMFNKLEFLDREGEWVLEDRGGGTYRLYVWPTDSGDPANGLYEATQVTGELISVSYRSNLVIDGLEVRHTAGYGHGIDLSNSSDITIQNCVVHDNEYMGIAATYSQRVIVRNTISTSNGYGLTIGTCTDISAYENDISRNTVDGIVISYDTHNVYVERSYIHDHILYGHPDNLQFHNDVYDIYYEDNAIINSGQSCMMEKGHGIHFINDIIAGSLAYMLHTGNPSDNIEIVGCTLAYSGYGLIGMRDTILNVTTRNNIYYHGHEKIMFGAGPTNNYISDYNVFYQGPAITSTANVLSWGTTWYSLAGFKTASGQEQHSTYADPKFVNAPAYWVQLDSGAIPQFTVNSVKLAESPQLFAVGDHIDFNFDGVVRTITAMNGNWITYDPPHDEPLLLGGCVANWKANTNYVLDFSLASDSPARGAGQGGVDAGSSVDLAAYRAGDFDGDGLRDIPVWPPANVLPDLVIAAAVDYNWVYQNTPVTTLDRHHCVLTVTIAQEARAGESYTAGFTENGGPLANFTVQTTANPLVWNLVGGRVGSSTPSAPAFRTIGVTLTGNQSGKSASASVQVALRLLGDIDGNGLVGLTDKVQMNKKLNGLDTTPYVNRHFDLTGDGVVGLTDKVQMNKVLNGLAIP